MARVWAVWAVIGRHKQAEMEFRCRNDVDLEPKEPKISNQCGLSQSDTIRASDIWRGLLISILIGPQDESDVPTPFARLRTAGNQAVRISQPDDAVMESGFVGNVQPTYEISDSRRLLSAAGLPVMDWVDLPKI